MGRRGVPGVVVAVVAVVAIVGAACAPAPDGATGWRTPTEQIVGRVDVGLRGDPITEGIAGGPGRPTIAFPLGGGVAVAQLAFGRLRLVAPDGTVTARPLPAGVGGDGSTELPLDDLDAALPGGRTAVALGNRVVVFLPDGTLDASWGAGGSYELPVAPDPVHPSVVPPVATRRPTDLAARPDGGLVIGSVAVTRFDSTRKDVTTAVHVLDPSGMPDPGVGTGGLVELGPRLGRNVLPAVRLDVGADGSVTVGRGQWGPHRIERLLADGTADPGFPPFELATDLTCVGCDVDLHDLDVDELGRTWVALGRAVHRLTDAGMPDLPFGGGDGAVVLGDGNNFFGTPRLERRSTTTDGDVLVNCNATGIARLSDAGVLDLGFAVPQATAPFAGSPPVPGFRAWDWSPGPGSFCCVTVRNGALYLVGSARTADPLISYDLSVARARTL